MNKQQRRRARLALLAGGIVLGFVGWIISPNPAAEIAMYGAIALLAASWVIGMTTRGKH